MSVAAAQLIVQVVAAYLGIGVLFAAAFSLKLAGRLDPGAAKGTWGFRALIIPGAALLWPFLLARLMRSSR